MCHYGGVRPAASHLFRYSLHRLPQAGPVLDEGVFHFQRKPCAAFRYLSNRIRRFTDVIDGLVHSVERVDK
jgi:hypothetical protein